MGDYAIFLAYHAGILGSDARAFRLVWRSPVSSLAREADFAGTNVYPSTAFDADVAARRHGHPSICRLCRGRDPVET